MNLLDLTAVTKSFMELIAKIYPENETSFCCLIYDIRIITNINQELIRKKCSRLF